MVLTLILGAVGLVERREQMESLPSSGGDDSPLLRSRLLASLSGDERLVVIHGGRFSGKSTLLRTWSKTCLPPGATAGQVITPDTETDDDAYWGEVLTSLGGSCTDEIDPFSALCHVVGSRTDPVTLVLDDVHLVRQAEARIGDLLRQVPRASFRVLASTRIAGGWYRHGEVPPDRILFTPGDLAFTLDEIGELADAIGAGVDRRALWDLQTETGGLAALVHAALKRRPAGFSGHGPLGHVRREIDRLLAKTLAEDPQLAATRAAILQLAVDDRLTEQSTNVVACDPSPSTPVGLLAELERLGMVEARVDSAEATWAFPAPVRASLLRLFDAEDPEGLRTAQLTLCRHWLDKGQARNAFVCAIDAAQWDLVLDILRDHWRVLYTSDFLHMEQDLARIPDHVLDSEPLFATLRRMHQQFSAPKDAPTSVHRVEPLPESEEPAERMMNAIALRIAGEFAASVEHCEPLMRRTPPPPEASQQVRDGFGFASVHIGISLITVGRFDDAIELLRRAHRVGAGTFIERDAAGKLALAHAMLGNLSAAENWIEIERRYPPLEPHSEMVVRPAGMVAHALTCIDKLDRNGALSILAELGPPDDREEFWGFIVYAHGLHSLVSGSPADGLRYVEHQLRRFPTMRDRGAIVGPLLDSVRADLHLALGELNEAATLIGDSTHPATAPVRARIRLLAGDAADALRIVERYSNDVRCTSRDSIELTLVAAAACLAMGAHDAAAAHLHRAIARSTLTGLLRPFVTLPADALLELRSINPDIPELPAGSVAALTTTILPSLTEREMTVLRSLASTATIQQISTAHFVSINTIKSQLRSIYRKLGARSRQEAVHRARTLGLLASQAGSSPSPSPSHHPANRADEEASRP